MTTMPETVLSDLIDLDRYPLLEPNHDRLRGVIRDAREQLALDGCARIPGFIHEKARAILANETTELTPHALHSHEEYTPYGTGADDSFPTGHPRRRTHHTTSGSVTRDLIPMSMHIQKLYCNKDFQKFVARCLETYQIYQFADPMRGLIINTMEEGNSLGWHYDANEFIVTLMTVRADAGGMFRYAPNIRTPGDEKYDDVKGVLDGTPGLAKDLDLQVGDLQVFRGRYSIHRVDPIEKGCRHTAVFGYAYEPGFIGNVESTMKVYGRVMQEHIDADDQQHQDGLTY